MSRIYANPFRWGKPVKGNYYIARPQETERISEAVEKRTPLVITGYSGSGKTSLILYHIERSSVDSIYVNLKFVVSRAGIIHPFQKALREKFPEVNQNPAFEALESEDSDSNLNTLFELLQDLAQKRGDNLTIVWDDFHHITKLKENVFQELSKAFGNKRGLSHVFISHKREILRELFENKQIASRQVEFMDIQSINDESFNRFLTKNFRQMGLSDFDLAQRILAFTGGQTRLTQKFAHSLAQLWLEGKTTRLVEQTINKMLKEHETEFSDCWDNFGLNERRLLIGLASGFSRPTELGFIKQFKLSATSTAHNTALKLVREGWLINREEGYYIYSPLFLRWLQQAGEQV